MSAVDLLSAIVCAGIFTGAGVVAALAVKRAIFPTWRGSEAIVVLVMVWICWALALGQLLGAVGLLRRGALTGAAVATAALALLFMSRTPRITSVRAIKSDEDRAGWPVVAATAALVLLVAAVWIARTAIAAHRGINDPDSLGYHLPFAVTFAQTGYANQHAYILPTLPVHFYPANDELLVAISLALTHSVAFAAVKNLLYAAFLLVAAHGLGKGGRSGTLAVAGTAIALGLPVIAFSQPGEATNDTLLVLAIVAGLALLAHGRDRPGPYILAMACAGMAVGIKFSGVVPAAALAVFALVVLRSRLAAHRWRWAGAGCLATVGLGGSWYLRNAITYGNPVPPSALRLGPIHLHQIPTEYGPQSYTVLHFVLRRLYLGRFAHGLRLGFGPLVLVVLLGWVAGAIVLLIRGDGFGRGVTVFALVTAIGYAATPASAFGLGGSGHNISAFVINLHYAAVALVAGFVACGLALGRWRGAWLFPALGCVVALSGIRSGQHIAFWAPEVGGAAFGWLVAAAGAGAVALGVAAASRRAAGPATAEPETGRAGAAAGPGGPAGGAAGRAGAAAGPGGPAAAEPETGPPAAGPAGSEARPPAGRRAQGVGVAAVVIALVGVGLVGRRYPRLAATDAVVQWAAQHRGARIAGYVPDTALLYGPGSHNRVVALTRMVEDAPVELNSCSVWMADLIAGHYRYTATVPGTVWSQWLNSQPALKRVARDPIVVVFEVDGRPNVSCPGQPLGP